MRAFWITVVTIETLLLIAGIVFARLKSIPFAVAAPIVTAFLMEAAVYLASGFPAARQRVERALGPPARAAALVIVALLSYLVYSVPLGLFAWSAAGILMALILPLAGAYLLFPPRRPDALGWQDLLVLGIAILPALSGVPLFDWIYPSPGDPVPPLDILGKLITIAVGAFAVLSLRGGPAIDYRFYLRRNDWRAALPPFAFVLPILVILAPAVGFARWAPGPFDGWQFPVEVAGKALGIFLAVALPEELCFRGVLQNLLGARTGRPRLAQAVAALAFGLVHISSRTFPNWPFALVAAVAGWFYGEAYRRGGVPAAAVTHTLTVLAWEFLFD